VLWESEGTGEFSIEMAERPARGTEITLHLKREGQDDLLSAWKLKSIIRKYSDHIVQPIVMKGEKWDDEAKKQVATDEDETVNQASALWARPKGEITEEQYKEFYKHVGHDFEDPLTWTHARVEGKTEYTQLLYVPARAPFDLWDRNAKHGVKLYVRRVFIMDDAEQLMPTYLRFVRGIVDSADLPLNVSREILQESKDIEAIRKGCTAKVLGLLDAMAGSDDAAEKEKYAKFWGEFGKVLKEGMGEDFANKDKIAGAAALRQHPGRHGRRNGFAQGLHRPHEARAGKDLLRHRRDLQRGEEQPAPGSLPQEGHRGHPALRPGRRVGGVAPDRVRRQADWSRWPRAASTWASWRTKPRRRRPKSEAGDFKDLTEKIGKSLGDKVKEVRVTHRLTDSPACLVADEHDVSGNLARILKAAGQKAPNAQPILEINPQAPGGAAPQVRREEVRRLVRRCCSTRPCSPRAASSTIRPPSSSA
jgi:molecular chaperone HtpG